MLSKGNDCVSIQDQYCYFIMVSMLLKDLKLNGYLTGKHEEERAELKHTQDEGRFVPESVTLMKNLDEKQQYVLERKKSLKRKLAMEDCEYDQQYAREERKSDEDKRMS